MVPQLLISFQLEYSLLTVVSTTIINVPMLTARPYQTRDLTAIYSAWAEGNRNVLYLGPTGSGKTYVAGKVAADYDGISATIAHRSELVLQQSMMLATLGQRHRIIANQNVTRFIIREHTRQFKRHYYDPNGRCAVVAVDTLRARIKTLEPWARQVTLWEMDEAHHVLRANKWGEATTFFPNAFGLGFTATSNRADGRGIGRHAQGVFDCMVQGPTVRDLMTMGYLSDYVIYGPPSDFDMSALKLGGTGDYTRDSMIKETRRSHIVGDIVDHYLKFARGKRGIAFAVDIESAGHITAAFVAAGIKAASVNGKSSDTYREEMVRRFRNGELDILVNVDLFGEGFDVPACEVVIMARPTQSLPLFLQMFGRALRVFKGKPHGIIIDHVSNVKRHLLPDSPRVWTLDDRDKRARAKHDPDAMPITTCTNPECLRSYEAITRACPYCGHVPEPAGRSMPDQVDGDLCEMNAEALAQMRASVDTILNRDPIGYKKRMLLSGTQENIAHKIAVDMAAGKDSVIALRDVIAIWAGVWRAKGATDSDSYRRFYHTFGTDVMSAQLTTGAMGVALAGQIRERIPEL